MLERIRGRTAPESFRPLATWGPSDGNRLGCSFLQPVRPDPSVPKRREVAIPERREVNVMKHLNLELEKLEQRIAPGGISLGGSIGLGVGVYVGGGTNGTCECNSHCTQECD